MFTPRPIFFRGAKKWSIIIKIGWPNITRHQVKLVVKLQNIIKLIVEAGNWIWDVSPNLLEISAQTGL